MNDKYLNNEFNNQKIILYTIYLRLTILYEAKVGKRCITKSTIMQ